jgi:tetratricopeptide (TPR) repeat protein
LRLRKETTKKGIKHAVMSENLDKEKNAGVPALPSKQPCNGPDPAFLETFTRAVEDCRKAMSGENVEQAEAAAIQMLQLVTEHAEQNPTADLVLQEEAGECEDRGDWAGAEEKRRKVLAIHEASGNAGLITKARLDLSEFFMVLGDLKKASEFARAATVAARESSLPPLQMRALENEALCALRRSDHSAANAAASAAFAASEDVNDIFRLGALVMRARCLAVSGDLEGAERDLAETKSAVVDRETSPIFAGIHGRAASWWEATGELLERRTDYVGAAEAWLKAVELRRHISTLPQVARLYTQVALARTLHRLGVAMESAGKPVEAQAAFEESRNLLSNLDLPTPH